MPTAGSCRATSCSMRSTATSEAEVLDRTIDVHIRRLRDKLDDDPDAPRYVQTVRGVGYRAARRDARRAVIAP